MPVHDYRCPHCGYVFEHWCPISALDDDVECPHCCCEKVNRVFRKSNVAIKVPFYVEMPQSVCDKIEQGPEKGSRKAKVDLGRFGKDKIE